VAASQHKSYRCCGGHREAVQIWLLKTLTGDW
jgi:hypothetical protein